MQHILIFNCHPINNAFILILFISTKATAMTKLHLTIPEPCHQDWNEMTPNEKGRFCNSCAKTVVDFSSMTDAQLIEYFMQLKGQDVCGNIHQEQLQRTMSSLPAPRKKLFRYWQYAAASLIMFFKAPQAKAQGAISSRITQADSSRGSSSKKTVTAPLLKCIAITDLDGHPIAGASVRFLSDENLLITDSAGRIYINKTNENEKLTISAIGYEEKTIVLKAIQFATVKMDYDIRQLENVTVKASDLERNLQSMTLGGIGYRAYQISYVKDSLTKITNFFSPSPVAYPNPVMRGNTITISLKLKQSGMYRFYIYDASGRLLMAQNHPIPAKSFTQSLNIPAGWSKGTYFIAIAGDDGKSIGKTKIVVQ
jgi:hypothetical protein